MLTWMYWTPEVAIFFACVVAMLAGMTVWEMRAPTVERKGFLPISTTRGDRLFIGLLAAAYVNLGWLAVTSEGANVWPGVAASAVVLLIVMWKG
jgi:predicted small integral membrane protein